MKAKMGILLPQLLRQECLCQGIALEAVIDGITAARDFERCIRLTVPNSAAVVIESEKVSVDLSAVPLADILSFRDEFGVKFRRHATSLRAIAAASASPDDMLCDKADAIADSAEDLRRLTRTEMRRIGDYWGMGLVWQAGADPADVLSYTGPPTSPIEIFSYFLEHPTTMRELRDGRHRYSRF